MKRILQIITFIFVLAASLFFVAGQSIDYFVFKYRQNTIRKEIKKEIKAGVSENDLVTFSVTEVFFSGAEWVKPKKEFQLNGNLYDVVRVDEIDGKFYYKCINDTQEKELFAELDRLIEKRMNDNSGDEYLKNLIKDFVKYIPGISTKAFITFFESQPSIEIGSALLSFDLNTLSPPPEV